MYKVGDRLKCVRLCTCGCLDHHLNNIGIITNIDQGAITIKFNHDTLNRWVMCDVKYYFKLIRTKSINDSYLPKWF